MNNNTQYPNYPYLSGALESFIKSLTYQGRVPGMEVTNAEQFEQFIQEQVKRIRKEAVHYNNTNAA